MKIAEDQLLIVIDPQKDFTSVKGAYADKHKGITQILATRHKIDALLKLLPENRVIVIYSDYQQDQFAKGVSMCIPGTAGHEIDLDNHSTHLLLPKTEHSCFSSKEFQQYLQKNKVKSLVLCGFLAEYCVKQTAIDGLALGYHISIPGDLIATGDDVQERITHTLAELEEKGAEISY